MLAISLDPGTPSALMPALTAAPLSSVADGLRAAQDLADEHAFPGEGRTVELWSALASVAAVDLGLARAMEPHLDAVAILHQASESGLPSVTDSGRTWGVFAAEGPGEPLRATHAAGSWTLSGTKPWCSLAGTLDSALVSATLDAGGRGLFAIDLHAPGVEVVSGDWHARGLVEIPSGPVRFVDVPALPVGGPNWYLERPGFQWGAIGVAACWFGGAVGLGRTLFAAARASGDPLLLMHLGAVDEMLESSRAALLFAAHAVDAGRPARLLARRTRATVARSAEAVITHLGHALGPAPLALDAAHAKRVADLTLYLRQDHAEKDLRSLGAVLTESEGVQW